MLTAISQFCKPGLNVLLYGDPNFLNETNLSIYNVIRLSCSKLNASDQCFAIYSQQIFVYVMIYTLSKISTVMSLATVVQCIYRYFLYRHGFRYGAVVYNLTLPYVIRILAYYALPSEENHNLKIIYGRP